MPSCASSVWRSISVSYKEPLLRCLCGGGSLIRGSIHMELLDKRFHEALVVGAGLHQGRSLAKTSPILV